MNYTVSVGKPFSVKNSGIVFGSFFRFVDDKNKRVFMQLNNKNEIVNISDGKVLSKDVITFQGKKISESECIPVKITGVDSFGNTVFSDITSQEEYNKVHNEYSYDSYLEREIEDGV